MSTTEHHRHRGRRWLKRILLGLGAVIVIAVAAVVITLHTDYGRELIRTQVETQLNAKFIGGASIAKVEGSPLGDLYLKGVVINGPDKKPAITIGSVKVRVGLMPLVSKQARVLGLVVDQLDVTIKRDANGELQIAHMMKPSGPDSGWSVDIPDIQVKRSHLSFDTGTKDGVYNLDHITIYAAAHMPHGKPLDANISLRGAWREKAAPLALDAIVHTEEGVISVPSVTALLGGVTIAGQAIRIVPGQPGVAPVVDGTLVVNAPAAEVAKLVPNVKLPADIAVAISASSEIAPWTQISMIGQLGPTPVRAMLSADLAKQRAMGVVASGDLDLTTLSQGTVEGHGGGIVIFDGAMGRDGELPVATGMITAWGELLGAPNANVQIAFTTDGERAGTVVALDGEGLKATLAANVKKIGDTITLDRATLLASTSNPAAATGGKAPVRGSISVNLAASGQIAPAPNLAIEGRIKGKRLRMKGLSVASLDLAVDASQLPKQPRGKMELRLEDIIRNDMHLGQLEVDAANRPDGRIAVAVRSRPKQSPWLIDVDALVTPPGKGDVVAIDIQNHHIRAGSGGNWYGKTGHLEIGPEQLLLRDLVSAGANGKISISALMDRAGRDAGDLIAKVDATGISLDNISPAYRGNVDAHVDVVRKDNRWGGDVAIFAKGIAADPRTLTIDADLKVHAHADQLQVDAKASSLRVGAASFQLDVDAPKDIANVEMWKHLHRDVIRQARVSFERLDLGQLAELAGKKGELSGSLDGDIQINATATGGMIRIRDVMAPALAGTGGVNADLKMSQTASDELSPMLTGTVGGIGDFEVIARLGMPGHLFDPAAWKALGPAAMRGATVRVDNVIIEPGLLDRFHLTTDLRGRASFSAELSEAMRSAQIAVDLTELRGTPIAEPVQAHFAVAVDDKSANTTLAVRAKSATLLDLRGTVPVTMEQLRADPRAVLGLPLDVTATIPSAPAPTLLNVFGRTEIIGGTIKGLIKVKGTVGKPTLTANIVGAGLQVPPGPNHRPIKTIENIMIDAAWDGVTGKLAVNGTQQNGMLQVIATGSPSALEKGSVTIKAKAFDLVPLLVFAPGPAGGAAGRLDADLEVTGLDPAKAKIAGELHLTDARLPVAPNIGTLRRAKVDVIVGNNLQVKVVGKLGDGDVTLNSTISMNGAQPTGGEATITLRKISPIGTVEPDIDANIETKLRREGDKWIADVAIRNGSIKIPKARGEKLKPVGAPPDMVFMTGDRVTRRPMKMEQGKVPKRPTFIANITLYSTYIESAEVRGLLKGKMTVSLDADNVGIVGQIAADRADLDLFGRRYQVETAAVRFDGTTDPLLDLRITHDFPDVTTVTQVRGRLSKPELIMSSNPGIYSQGQLLGFLLGGEPSGDPQAGSARDQVTAAGTSFIANKLGGYVRNALPVDIDVLRYEAAGASSSAAITVGSWLSRSLFIAYRRHLEARPDENTGEGEIEYWLSRRVVLEGVVGDRGYNGIDLLWRKRY
jgi:autotransporter translocation and assembly factor TamB